MDLEADFLVNPFSYILVAVSFVGFFIVARDEIKLWFLTIYAKYRAAKAEKSAAPALGRNHQKITGRVNRQTVVLGLVFIGIVISAAMFIINARTEQLEPSIHVTTMMLVMFAFTILPGGLTGLIAGAWINATRHNHQGDLLEELAIGMIAYLILIVLIELTQFHLLFFFSGTIVTLLVYKFSPA